MGEGGGGSMGTWDEGPGLFSESPKSSPVPDRAGSPALSSITILGRLLLIAATQVSHRASQRRAQHRRSGSGSGRGGNGSHSKTFNRVSEPESSMVARGRQGHHTCPAPRHCMDTARKTS